MRKYLVKVCVILSFVLMILTLGFASSNNTVYAKTYDKTPENCTHNRAQVKEITVSSSALQKEPGYTNDGVAKHSTGASVFYTKQSNVTAPGTSEVTIEVILDEAKTINVYYLFQRQRAQYCRAYVTITHDGVAGSEVEIVNQNWNIDTVECHAGTNTLKYKCRVTKGTWAGPGRRFYVIPDYVPSFDENDRCTQCGLQCDHKESSMHYDDNNHWYQCDDLCGKTFESTKHEHEYDEDNQCVVCGVVNMQKDANDYYLISNPAELATFTKYINVDGKTNIKGKLTADLNLKDINFEPIGNSARVFVGEFDGGNHRIYNLNLIEENYSGAGLGFFGYAGSTSTGTAQISNLTIDKSCSFASNNVTAALVGYVKGTINIDHCGNEANVTSLNPSAVNSISAGLVAFGNEGIVNMTYCYNTGTIIGGSGYYGLAEDNAFYYGSAGLIGYVQAFNIDCSYNAGNVTTTICENDGQYQYVKESYHMTSFGNATGAAGAKVGENCYNYEAVNYGDGNGTVTKYSLITDSSILTALNANNQDGVKFVQDTDYPILAPRKVFVDSKHCKHDYEVSRYEWAEDYSKCKGIAACKNCGDTLVEEQNSTKTTINAPGELGLQMIYYTVVFENNTVFAPQKTLVEYKMAPTHKITLNANGGTGTPCAFYYEGFGTDLPYDYIKDGNYIEGWYLNADFTGEKVTKILATEKEDKVLYAKYEEHTCTLVDFDAVAPTCTTNGMTAGQRCSECGTIREGGEVILALGHDFVITADTASITARCSREGCNEVVTISLVRKDTGVEITNTEAWMAHGFLVPTVYYVGTGTTVYESTPIMPNVKGTYKATMTYEGKTAELEYLMKKQLDPTKKTDLDLPDHSPLYDDDEISVDTDIEDITIEWFYDDNGDGTPDSETPIGTGTTYIVKCPDENDPTHDDRGHKIIAKVTQNKKEDGTDYEEGQKPVQYSNPVLVYTSFTPDPENKTEVEVPDNKTKAEDGDELSVDVAVKPVTVKWYYDDNDDGIPDDLDNPIGEGLTYTVKCPDTNNPNHDDTGHKIIAVITQDKKPDGTDYQEGDAPREITDPIIVKGNVGGFEELNQTTKPDINIPDDKEEADIEDELSVDTNAKPIEVKWYYDDNNDGKPDFSTPIGEGLTYQIISQDPNNPAHNDTGHKIIAVITQNKNEDGDYLPTSQIKTVTSNPIKVAGVIPHTHNFTYKANGTTITATCTNSYCIITEGLTLTLQAPEGDMVYDGNPRVATLAEGYSDIAFPNATIKYYSNNKEVTSCVDAGKYTAKVTFGNATVSVTFTIENWKEADEAHPEVKAEIVGAAEDENVHIKVEVKTTITAEATPADYDAVKAKLESDEQITTVYEVKLIRTINGADTVIQPSDLEDGATIIVTMDIPDGVKIGSFRILHIHGPNDSEFIDDFTVIGRTVQFKVSRLSEFAFVIKTTPSNHGFCGGWVLFIFVILQLLFLCFFCLLPLFNKKDKLVGKVDLFKLIGLGSSIVVLFIAVIVLALDACTVAVVSAILSALVCIAYIVFTIIDLVRIPVRN